MFAIAFDMTVADLKKHYDGFYTNAYFEIGKLLQGFEFYNVQGSLYMTENNDLGAVYKAMKALSDLEWFRLSVRDIRAFRVEDWSDFTQIVKGGE